MARRRRREFNQKILRGKPTRCRVIPGRPALGNIPYSKVLKGTLSLTHSSSRSSPSLLVASLLSLLFFPAFAQLSNKRLSLSLASGASGLRHAGRFSSTSPLLTKKSRTSWARTSLRGRVPQDLSLALPPLPAYHILWYPLPAYHEGGP
jgi:hypothetical protein